MKTHRVLALAAPVALLIVSACVDGGAPLVAPGRSAQVALVPQFAAVSAPAAGPISRIRLTALREGTGETLGQAIVDVDPNAQRWDVTVVVELPGNTETSVVIEMVLLSRVNNREVEEYSGRTAPLRLAPGAAQTVTEVTVYPGPPANLDIVAVRIGQRPSELIVGESFQLTATIEGGAPGARVFWTALDPAVLTVSDAGEIRAVGSGNGRVVAAAGPKSDVVFISVRERAASIEITPQPVLLEGLGVSRQLTATARAPDGSAIPGLIYTWRSSNTAIVTVSPTGLATSVAPGSALIEASADGATGRVDALVLVPNLRIVQAELRTPVAGQIGNGDEVTAFVAFQNTGNTVAPAAHAAVRVLDASNFSEVRAYLFEQPAVAAGGTLPVGGQLVVSGIDSSWPDQIIIEFVVDALNEIAESDETDNTVRSSPLSVRR